MPRIPIYETQVKPSGQGGGHPPKGLGLFQPEEMIQGQKGKAQIAGAAAKGLQAAGAIYGEAMGKQAQAQGSLSRVYDAVAQFGNKVADLGENIYKLEQTSLLTGNLTAAEKELTELHIELSKRGDHTETEKDWRENSQKIKDKYAKDLNGPYRVQYDSRFDSAALSGYVQIAGMIHRSSVDKSISVLAERRQWSLQQILTAGIEDQKKIDTDYLEDVDASVANGVIKATDGVQIKQAYLKQSDYIKMQQMTEQHPDLALKFVEEGRWPNLDPERITEYKDRIKAKIKENGFNSLFGKLMLQNRNDIEGLAERLRDEEYYTGLGLDAQDAYRMRNQVMAEINRDKAIDAEQLRVAADNELNQVYGLWSRGDLVGALTVVENSPFLKEKDRMSLRSQIKKAAVTTDEADFGQALIAFYAGQINGTADLVKYRVMPDKYEYFAGLLKKRDADKRESSEGGFNYYNKALEDYDRQAPMQEDTDAGKAWRANRTKLAIALHLRLEQEGIKANDPKAWLTYKELMEPDEENSKSIPWWRRSEWWLYFGGGSDGKVFEKVFTGFESGLTALPPAGRAAVPPPPVRTTVRGEIIGANSYEPIIKRYADQAKIDPRLVASVIQVESNFDPNIVGTSGEVGLMQLMPKTATQMGVADVYNPEQNIAGGVAYLAQMIEYFGSVELGLAAYNAGPGAVKAAGGIPQNGRTPGYVRKIMTLYEGEKVPADAYHKIAEYLMENGIPATEDRIKTVYQRLKAKK